MPLRTVALAVAAAAAAWPALALRAYDKSTTLPGGQAALSWTVVDDSAELGVVVSDANVAKGKLPWLGIGIGDPQSGGMLGADIATVLFAEDGSCSIQDRHVPSVGYPLGSSNGGDAVFPEEDDCSPSAWEIVSCTVDKDAGTISMEVDRALKAQDPAQDRDIDRERNVVLVAWGDGFGYHGANRLSTEVNFTRTGPAAAGAQSLAESGLLPKDVVAEQLLMVNNFQIPARGTTYMCQGFTVNRPESGGPRQVVAIEPVIDLSTSAGKMVHHFIVWSCDSQGLFKRIIDNPISCGNEQPSCRDVVYGWAKGQGPLLYPEIGGLPITDEERFFVVQIHYDNPEGKEGVVDSSSAVRLHFTDTPRKQDVGTINIGDPFVQLTPLEVVDNYNYSIECPVECLSQMKEPVTIYQSFLHSHTSGKQMWTNMYRNGKFLKTLEGTAFWSNNFQRDTLFERTVLEPTDSLVISANYDTRKRRAAGEPPVKWGLATKDEMIMTFLFVSPRPFKKNGIGLNYCGVVRAGFSNVTMCTDGQAFRSQNEIIRKDPFQLSVSDPGFNTAFGGAPQCSVSETVAPTGENVSEDGETACFPTDSLVQLESGERIPMGLVEVGDRVLVDKDTYSEVFMFTHRMPDTASVFNRIETGSGAVITLSPGHYIPVSRKGLVASRDVLVGDSVHLANGDATAVTSVQRVVSQGLYNPQTLHGQVVVDGIIASSYTEAVPAAIAHAALYPLRYVYRMLGWNTCALDSGAPSILKSL